MLKNWMSGQAARTCKCKPCKEVKKISRSPEIETK